MYFIGQLMINGDSSIRLVLHDGRRGKSYGDREVLCAASITVRISLLGESF